MLAENFGRGNGAEEVLRACRFAKLSGCRKLEVTMVVTWTSGLISRQHKPNVVRISALAMPRFKQEAP
jgi:hypothetical protein